MMVTFVLKVMVFSLNNQGGAVVACLGCTEEAWAAGTADALDSGEFHGILPYWQGRSQGPFTPVKNAFPPSTRSEPSDSQ